MSFHRRSTAQKLSYARFLREHPTRAEQRLWEALRTTSWGNEVLRQQRIAGWIADLHFARQGLVVEIDGKVHENRLLTDLHRDRVMEGRGLRVLRIPSELVPQIEDQILTQIRIALFLEATPDLPLGPKLWQHLRERARRDLMEIHRLNQRMFLAHQFWEGTTLHLQKLSETGFRLAAEVEFEALEDSETWLTGWEKLVLSDSLRRDTPDILFFHKEEIVTGLLLLPATQLKHFLENEQQTWSTCPYPCLIVPVNEQLYRSERPWHYGQPLPVLDLVLGTHTDPKKRLHPFVSPQALGTKRRHLRDKELREKDPPSPEQDIFPSEETQLPQSLLPPQEPISSTLSEIPTESSASFVAEATTPSPKAVPLIHFARDGWPSQIHAFRIADLYLAQGETKRELFWVLPDPRQEGGALLFCQSTRTILAQAPPPLEDALHQLSEDFRNHLICLQQEKIFADSPMRWKKLTTKQRRNLRKDMVLGYFPQRYLWDERAQQWQQPRYTRQLRWDVEQENESSMLVQSLPNPPTTATSATEQKSEGDAANKSPAHLDEVEKKEER